MHRLLAIVPGLALAVGASGLAADATGDALDRGLRAVRGMAGCASSFSPISPARSATAA